MIAAWEEICNTAEWAFNTARDTISDAMTRISDYVREKVDEIKQMVKQMKNYGKTPVETVSEVAPAKTVKRSTLDYWM